jgi:death-on-curing protein
MIQFRFLGIETIIAIHDQQLAVHGGLAGVRDMNAQLSARARPEHILAYEPDADVARIAAAYAFGLARNHAFSDGNKRSAFMAMAVFLSDNGYVLQASDKDCLPIMLRLAAGDLSEADVAAWLRANLAPLEA